MTYDETRTATEAEAHVEWHCNSGVPVGQGPCPWDACDPYSSVEPDAVTEKEEAMTCTCEWEDTGTDETGPMPGINSPDEVCPPP